MEKITFGFGSDNHSAIHPKILNSLIEANLGHAPSYGQDSYSRNALNEFKRVFGDDIDVHFVFSGTAANVLSIKALIKSYESVICSESAHLNVDECGAPEMISGSKLVVLKDENGKITADQIRKKLIRIGDQHFSQPKLVSITQPTELGTVYNMQELEQIREVCRENNLLIHVDGARFFSAVESLGVSAKELCEHIGVDALSLSGSKNGFMLGEAVVIFNREMAKDFKFIRKQCMQLPSKTRFFAAQFKTYLSDDLYLEMARHQREMAQYLESKISPIVQVTRPVQTNAVFAIIPKPWFKPLRQLSFFYVWNPETWECRLMTTFDTKKEQIDRFAEKLRELKAAAPSS